MAILTGWDAFDLAVAAWEAQDQLADGVRNAAIEALSAGCDSPSLRVVAGLDVPAWSELRPLLAMIRDERGLPPMTDDEVDELRMVELVSRIVDGTLTPRQGARAAYALLVDLDRHGDGDLSPIAYVDDSYDLLGTILSDREALDAEVLLRSGEFLVRRGLG